MYEAAFRAELPALAVRGISDHLDDKDPDGDAVNQPNAAANAAHFTVSLLKESSTTTIRGQSRG